MKRLKYVAVLVLTALIGLSSCSSESNSSAPKNQGLKVNLTISNAATTRTAEPTNLGGFAREKVIDGTKLYAVVFDTQGKFSKTYPISDYDASDGSCSFTLNAAGAYYGYIVANTSKGTELQALTAGTSTEDDFYNIVEDTDPGADLAASTNFLMISKRTLFDVDGENDTALGAITLSRAVARIDIDATAIPGLTVTEVSVENRYVKSLLVRGGSPAALTSATDTKVYTRGTGAGEVAAVAADPSATALVTDQQWQGVIYGYENTATNTIVRITHTMNGVASTTTVDFSTANAGAGQAIKRNNIYTVKLTDGAGDGTLQNIDATILVTDWDASTSLKYTELTDDAKPDFKVTSTHSASRYDTDGDADTKKNPGMVLARKSDATTEIELQVISNGKVASVVSFLDKNGSTYDFAGAGGDITQNGATTLVDGKIVQNFTISIPQAVVVAMTKTDYLTFKVHNVFNDTPTASREFIIPGDIFEGIQVGDLIYQDGTWSTASNRNSAENASKTPVAIVFATADDATNPITMPEYDRARGYIHGYAVALKESSSSATQWSTTTLTEYVTDTHVPASGTVTLSNGGEVLDDISGLEHCAKIQEKIDAGTYTIDNFPAYKSAIQYVAVAGETLTEQTSGWFLPSAGQTFYWYLMTGDTQYTKTNWGKYTANNENISWYNVSTNSFATYIAPWLTQKLVTEAGLTSSDYTTFVWHQGYWTSSERTINYPWIYGDHFGNYESLDAGFTSTTTANSNMPLKVRPILAI